MSTGCVDLRAEPEEERAPLILKKDGFKVSFGPVLQHSLNPSVTLLNWVKVYNAVCTPTPIHRQAVHTDISSTTENKRTSGNRTCGT